VLAAWLLAAGVAADGVLAQTKFDLARRAEVVATITARCDGCAWDTEGREAVTLVITLDGRYSQHLPLVRRGMADYRIMLGGAAAGTHTVRVQIDPPTTARELRQAGAASIERISILPILEGEPDYTSVSLAPFIYARPNTVGRFTDVPVFMWYEVEPTRRGQRFRYTVVFTNEDGGTPADRLMATWGRTTDIEYVYSVEVDSRGAIIADDFQGPEHEILTFRGRREGRHPLLWVSTDNNMMRDGGTTAVRYAPAPIAFPLREVSREAVMDAEPWLYALMAQELSRERKIVTDAPAGTGTIPDPRRFLYIEACGEIGDATLAFAVRVGDEWVASDRGRVNYRIERSGCFRGAIPLPGATTGPDVSALRVHTFEKLSADGTPPADPPAPVRVTRINRVFMLDEQFVPGPSLLRWEGVATLFPGSLPLEVPVK